MRCVEFKCKDCPIRYSRCKYCDLDFSKRTLIEVFNWLDKHGYIKQVRDELWTKVIKKS